MATLWSLIDDAATALTGKAFDPSLIGQSYIDLGAQAQRARTVASRLNAVRSRPPKMPVLLHPTEYLAVTRRGPWIYMSTSFASRLSDPALAFVLAHEMAHHDLDHLSLLYASAGLLGNWQKVELAADREAVELCRRAGFDPHGAIEAMDQSGDEAPEERNAHWSAPIGAHLDRLRRSHPPMRERKAALLRRIG